MTDTKDKKREKLGILCCTAGATSWGLSGTCSEALFSQYPVDTTWVTAVRMTSAGIILLFLAFAKHSLNLKELGKDKKGLIEIVLFAIAGLALCQYAYLSAIKWTNSGTATVIQNLSIVFIAVYVCLTTRTAPDKRTVICIFLFGVWLLATGGKPGNMELTPRGLFWGLMAGIGAASYSLLSRAPVKHRGSIPVSGMGMSIVANKHKGVYAAVCENTYAAEKSRAINNANILTMGGWITGEVVGCQIADTFLNTEFTQNLEEWRANNLRNAEKKVKEIEEQIYG